MTLQTRQEFEKCSRTICTNPHDNCKHTQDGRLYCRSCAMKINRANPEVPNLVSIPVTCEHIINAHGCCQRCHKGKFDLEYEAMKRRLFELEEVYVDEVDGNLRWLGSGKSVYYG